MKLTLITAELIADMRKAVPVLVRASEVLEHAGGASWHPEDLRYAAENFQRALDQVASKPRTLHTLECAEARDGTVWRDTDSHAWLYRYTDGQWWWKTPSARSWQPFRDLDAKRLRRFLCSGGPYTAVGQSAGESL